MISAEQAKQTAIKSIRTNASVSFCSIRHYEPHWLSQFLFTYKSGRSEYVVIKVNSETGEVEK